MEIENNPSVSKISMPSQLLKFYNLIYVPYIPLVHLPVLVMKSHPNKKFNNVDLPELCGPITDNTKTFSLKSLKMLFKNYLGM